MRGIMLLLIATCGVCLHADFEATIEGVVSTTRRAPVHGAEVRVEVDNRWGCADDDALAAFQKRHGPLPTLDGATVATSDEAGKFRISISVKTSGEGKLPRNVLEINGAIEWRDYAAVTLFVSAPGYRSFTQSGIAFKGGDADTWQVVLQQESTFQVSFVYLADRSPAANVKVSVAGQFPEPGQPRAIRTFEVTTDAAGLLKLDDAQCPHGSVRLRVTEPGLAFPSGSRGWQNIPLGEGVTDAGTLAVVPGGGVRFEVLHADTGQPVKVHATLRETPMRAGGIVDSQDECLGQVSVPNLSEGKYSLYLSLPSGEFWNGVYVPELEVKPGECTDLGVISFEPVRNLAIVAVNEEGEKLQAFSVVVEQLSGFRVGHVNGVPRGKPQPWTEHANQRGEENINFRLASGVWRVAIRAPGHVPSVTDVTLPATEPLTVRMEQAGEVSLVLSGESGRSGFNGEAVLVSVTAPCYEEIRECTTLQALFRLKQGLDLTGVIVANSNDPWPGYDPLKVVRPGTYVVFAGSGHRVDDVVVRAGEKTEVLLAESPATLKVALQHEGRPLADARVWLVPVKHEFMREQQGQPRDAVTDADGLVDFESVPFGNWLILTAREYEWVSAVSADRRSMSQRLPYIDARSIFLAHGDRARLTVEQFLPGYTWLSVSVNAPDGVVLSTAELVEQSVYFGAMSARSATTTDRVFDFGPVPQNTYELSLQPKMGRAAAGTLMRVIDLDTAPVRRIDVTLEFASLTVTVVPPRGVDLSRVNVYVCHDGPEPWKIQSGTGLRGKPSKAGVIEFGHVPFGSYQVKAWIEEAHDRRFAHAAAAVSTQVSAATTVTLEFMERAGNLSVGFENSPRTPSPGQPIDFLRVQLLDSSGNPAAMGDPTSEYHTPERTLTMLSIAEGTYTLRISGKGFDVFEQPNVMIRPDVKVSVRVTLSLHQARTLILQGVELAEVQAGNLKVELLDADGEPVVVDQVEEPDFSIHSDWNGTVLNVFRVSGRVATMRLSVEGFKPVQISISRWQQSDVPTIVLDRE